MIRMLVVFTFLVAGLYLIFWLGAYSQGSVLITWSAYQTTYRIEMPLWVGFFLSGATFLVLYFCLRMLLLFFRTPKFFVQFFQASRLRQTLLFISQALFALEAGDIPRAQKASRWLKKYFPKQSFSEWPLPELIAAKTYALAGQHHQAQTLLAELKVFSSPLPTFSHLLSIPQALEKVFPPLLQPMTQKDRNISLAGLRGLVQEAQGEGDEERVYAYAFEAYLIGQPSWAYPFLVAHHVRHKSWIKAAQFFEEGLTYQAWPLEQGKAKLAALKTGAGRQLFSQATPDFKRAQALAEEALQLAPNFVPAVILWAEILTAQDQWQKAAKILENQWRINPHPDMGSLYLHLRKGDKAAEHLARAQNLADFNPDHPESLLLVAQAAVSTECFALAQTVLEALTARAPSQKTWLRRAEIALHLASSNVERIQEVHHCLDEASRAPLDAFWVSPGFISENWHPASPVDGTINSLSWQIPPPLSMLAQSKLILQLMAGLKHLYYLWERKNLDSVPLLPPSSAQESFLSPLTAHPLS